MKLTNDNILTLLKDISSLASFQTSINQVNDVVDLLLREILELVEFDGIYIGFKFKENISGIQIFSRCVGIEIHIAEQINQLVNKNYATLLKNNSNPNVLSLIDLYERYKSIPAELSKFQSVIRIPLLLADVDQSLIFLYSSGYKVLEEADINILSTIGIMMTTNINMKFASQELFNRKTLVNNYFEKLWNAVLVVDENFFIVYANAAGRELIGGKMPIDDQSMNLSQFVSSKDLEPILQLLGDLRDGEISKELTIRWLVDGGPTSIQLSIGFTKTQNIERFTHYILSGRILSLKESLTIKSRSDVDFDLVTRLLEIREYYMENSLGALMTIKTEMFPAAFAFVVNEESGPLPLVTSPDVPGFELMQDTIRLMAGLNTTEIVNQVYISGTTPWSHPHGELRWIAFTRANTKARGNTEFHLIGIVIERNLVNIIPQLNQLVFGILLGGMNNYLSLLDDDKADFVTTLFNNDRNFSTITLVKRTLEELRDFASELLPATLSNLQSAI